MSNPKSISVLGSTGSIGVNTLQIAAKNTDRIKIKYLTANKNSDLIISQTQQFLPNAIAITDPQAFEHAKNALKNSSVEILFGKEGLNEIASRDDVDLVVNAVVGKSGLEPTICALEMGKDIALANKESLVMAGEWVMKLTKERNATVFPIDSEHSAIWQCLSGENQKQVNKIILTGSGGPFRQYPLDQFSSIAPEQALKHPNWSMGAKITVDSATMMNKGLEIIEARWLFDFPPEQIEILIHPQSIIHSMVEFVDGSIKAQLGLPDMKIPIQYALSYPDRWHADWEKIDFTKLASLTFESPDLNRFPCLSLAMDALERGGIYPAALNIMNEFAVYAFLDRKILFTDIAICVEQILSLDDLANWEINLQSFQELETVAKDILNNIEKQCCK